jgi:hypothetical protein
MNLVDRYVAAIGRELPRRNAAEITAELKDVLLSKIEDQEAELGRPLTDKEIEQLLIDFGHPLVVAGSYRKMQYLIGPELFPYWVATVRMVLMIGGAIVLAGILVAGASATTPVAYVIQHALAAAWPALLYVFGDLTMVFAAIQWSGKDLKVRWTPRRLPPARAPGRKRFDVMAEIAGAVVVLLWWTGLLKFRALLPTPPAIVVHLSGEWAPFYGPVIAFLVFEIAIDLLALMQPGLGKVNAGLSMAKHLAGCAIAGLILKAGHWVDIVAPAGMPAQVQERMTFGFNRGVQLALTVVVLVMAIKAILDAWRLWRTQQESGGAGDGDSAAATFYTA